MPSRFLAIAGAVFIAAAAPPRLRAAEPTCPPGGTALRWEGFAVDFFDRHCNTCHAWRSYPDVYLHGDFIGDLVRTQAMPPFERLAAEEISRLSEWIACDLPYDGPSCPPRGTHLSFDSFVRDLLEQNCTRCHSKDLPEESRNGAPPGYNWDDFSSVKEHALEIRDVALKGRMPPDAAPLAPSEVEDLVQWIACGAPEHPSGTLYRRADANDDGVEDLTDALLVLSFLFRGDDLGCRDAADVDGNGKLEITDAVYLLGFLFSVTPAPPPPFRVCGGLPALGCEQFSGCSP